MATRKIHYRASSDHGQAACGEGPARAEAFITTETEDIVDCFACKWVLRNIGTTALAKQREVVA